MCIFCGGILEAVGIGIICCVVHNFKNNISKFMCKIGLHNWQWIHRSEYKCPSARQLCKHCNKERK